MQSCKKKFRGNIAKYFINATFENVDEQSDVVVRSVNDIMLRSEATEQLRQGRAVATLGDIHERQR